MQKKIILKYIHLNKIRTIERAKKCKGKTFKNSRASMCKNTSL